MMLDKLIRKFNRRFEEQRETLSPDALKAAHSVAGHLHSLGGVGEHSPTLRSEAVKAIDAFERVREVSC